MTKENKEIQIPHEEPLILTERQKWLCSHLDTLNRIENFCPNATPSHLFRGALYLTRFRNQRSNPDWMAQAAHSLREIMYGTGQIKKPKNKLLLILKAFLGRDNGVQTRRERIENILKVYQEEKKAAELASQLNDLHFIFTNIAHHFQDNKQHNTIRKKVLKLGITNSNSSLIIADEAFEKLIELLEGVWTQSIPHQLTIHKKIDSLLSLDSKSANKEFLNVLLAFNPDARQYFYSKVDERWLSWLWENGFLDAIKEKAEDPTRYGYRIPELNYLTKATDKEPARVVDIMLQVPISAENFNPEVVDRFLRICSGLPVAELKRMVKKIRDGNWVRLMGGFNNWGFEYEKILQVLANAKDYKSLLMVVSEILTVRTKDRVGKSVSEVTNDNPFYFNDLGYTKVFEYLIAVDDVYAEKVLAMTTETIREIFLIGEKESNDKTFEVGEAFYLIDVDFFKLELNEQDRLSYRDDVKNLAAVIKQFAMRTIKKQCENPILAGELYNKYFESLPDSRSMWRLRLFVISLCTKVFKEEFKKSFFKIFRADDKPWGLIGGAEYRRALHAGFEVLSIKDKRDYVTRVLEYFGKRSGNDINLWKSYGWSILSSAFVELTQEEKKKAEEVFGKPLDPDFEPEPSIRMREFAGSIISQAPDDKDWARPASEIAEKLRNEWSPRALAEKYKDTDFNRPTGAEGAGERLKKEISQRPQEFLENAQLFFNRESLDPHYTYSFLQGIHELLRNKRVVNVNIRPLLGMLNAIVASAKTAVFKSGPREKETSREWLSGWSTAHNAVADVTKELLSGNDKESILDFSTNRSGLLELISYLLKHSDPTIKDEEDKPSHISPGGEAQYTGSDPFTAAINSVRGRAFEALVNFLYWDDKQFAKDVAIRINSDVKLVYEELLGRENTRAVMFMFGHYLPSFYFRDKI